MTQEQFWAGCLTAIRETKGKGYRPSLELIEAILEGSRECNDPETPNSSQFIADWFECFEPAPMPAQPPREASFDDDEQIPL